MIRPVRTFVALSLIVGLGLPLVAADKAKKKEVKQKDSTAAVFSVPKKIELSADQKEQLEKIKQELGPKVKQAQDEVNAILTPERKKAAAEAAKVAKEAGKKGKELQEAMASALNLTDAEKTQLDAAKQSLASVQKEVKSRILAILSEEQKSQLGGKGAKKASEKKKKKEAA